MINKIKTAVVILNWNGEKFLSKFLPTIIEYSQNQDAEIFVADNGSSDSSVAMLKNRFPEVRLILLDKNYGFAGGYNLALSEIDAEYYVLLNSDVQVTPNWISPIIKFMDGDKNIAGVAPKIKSFDNKNMFEYAGAAGGFIDKFGYPFCRGRIINEIEEDKNQYNEISEIFWASGACMFVRAEYFNQVEGLDTDFFAHMEEIDLCWRLKNKGYKIMYFPGTEIFHVGGGTLSSENPFKTYLNFRNNLLLLYKNLHSDKVFFIIFARLMLDGISGMIYLLSFKFGNFFAVIKAHFKFYALLPKSYYKRKLLVSDNKKTHNQIYNKSIVFDFFVRKKKKFSELDITDNYK